MDGNDMGIDVGKVNHVTIALWVGDFRRAKDLLEHFSESAKRSMPFDFNELKSILRRRPAEEIQETNISAYEGIVNDLFTYGPLLIRMENLLGKISELDLESIEEETRVIKTRNFSFRIDEVGINVYELKGYGHHYPPVRIRLDDLEKRLREKFQPKGGDIELIDKDQKESPDSLTFQLTIQQPMVYAQLHVIRMGIIYGEVHTTKREDAERVSQLLFEELEEGVQKP